MGTEEQFDGLARALDEAVRIANGAADPGAGWISLVEYLEAHGREPFLQLRSVDVGDDIRRLRAQLAAVLKSEPPPSTLDAVFFGLFDTVDLEGAERIGFYVAGVAAFDPNDGDSLCDPAWWPDGRYLTSAALDAIKLAELSARVSEKEALCTLLGYAGQLGAALLVSRFASGGLFVGLRHVVGFDSGDFAVGR